MPPEKKTSAAKLAANRRWSKANLKKVGVNIRIEDAERFKAKCEERGIAQTEILKKAIYDFLDSES